MTSLNHNENRRAPTEQEEVYALMMEALDGELGDAGWDRLEGHLQSNSMLAQEWNAWQAVDSLFRASPALQPAADFTQRTLARLPDPRQRLWVVTGLYGLLLMLGVIPVLAMGVLLATYLPAMDVESGVVGVITEGLSIIAVVLRAIVGGAADFVAANPYTLGWLFVMAGLVFLWNGVYQQMVLQPGRSAS